MVSHLELAIVVERHGGPNAPREAEVLLRTLWITIEPVSLDQGEIARQAF